MTSGEGTAGAGLEVALEAGGARRIGEFDRGKQTPGTELRRVVALASVVGRKTGRHIRSQAFVVTRRVGDALKDVDEAMRLHGLQPCKIRAGGFQGNYSESAKSSADSAMATERRSRKGCDGGSVGLGPPSQRVGLIDSSRCCGGTDFACSWLAQTSAFTPSLFELRRRRRMLGLQTSRVAGLPRRSSPEGPASRRRAKSGGGGSRTWIGGFRRSGDWRAVVGQVLELPPLATNPRIPLSPLPSPGMCPGLGGILEEARLALRRSRLLQVSVSLLEASVVSQATASVCGQVGAELHLRTRSHEQHGREAAGFAVD